MKEVLGDLWKHRADVRVITTNGDVKQNGEAVMGKGTAEQLKQRYPGVARHLGSLITRYGNRVYCAYANSEIWEFVYTFPTKHHWAEPSDPALIRRSASQLLNAIDDFARDHGMQPTVVLPRVGCGAGGLDWDNVVKPLLRDILDDRFIIVGQEERCAKNA